jgi:WD40 repeat protein
MEDLDRKYSRLPADQLLKYLQHATASFEKVGSLGILPSLLQPLNGVYNNADPDQRNTFKTLMIQLSDSCSKLRANKEENRRLRSSKEYLCSEVEKAAGEEEVGMQKEILSEHRTYVPEDEECVVLGINMQPILKDIGQKKELISVALTIDKNINNENKLLSEISRLINALSSIGCLSSGLDRGCVDSGMCFINNRMLGLTKWNSGQIRGPGLAMKPSAERMRRKMMYNYRLLWTVSGHALNPAYCTIIDGSGRFAITGADDYLVKVWDIENGTLALTCRGHNGFISIIALSPDNSLLASACTLGVIRIWRLRDGCCIQVLKHGDKQVNWIAFDRTNCALTSVGDEGSCIVWDLTVLLALHKGDIPLIDVLKPDDIRTYDLAIGRHEQSPLPSMQIINGAARIHDAAVDRSTQKSDEGVTDLSEPSPCTEMDANLFASSLMHEDSLDQSNDDRVDGGQSNGVDGGHGGNGITSMNGEHYNIQQPVDSLSSHSSLPCRPWRPSAHAAPADFILEGSAVRDVSYPVDLSGPPVEMVSMRSLRRSAEQVMVAEPGPSVSTPRRKSQGLFEWNLGQFPENLNKLVLPHIRDAFSAAPGNEGIKVQCLDVSPLGGVLATGCEDGIVRVWRYGVISTSSSGIDRGSGSAGSSHPMKGPDGTYDEETYRTLKMAFSPRELERIKRVSDHMLPRLEGHVSGVTDLRFSNEGDRIVTGSLLDGTVRIWAFNRDFTKNDHIVLVMADDDEEGSSSAGGKNRGGRRTMNRQKNKPQVNSVCWTKNDLRVVTLQSVHSDCDSKSLKVVASTRLKVWDSVTGDLLRVISCVSTVTANVLYPHPLDPSVVLTGGEDGYVAVWDIDNEERLSSFYFPNPLSDSGDEMKIHDASFSPDGSRVAVTDSLGRLSILGLDDPARYKNVAKEQYYSTDYQDIMMYVTFVLHRASIRILEKSQYFCMFSHFTSSLFASLTIPLPATPSAPHTLSHTHTHTPSKLYPHTHTFPSHANHHHHHHPHTHACLPHKHRTQGRGRIRHRCWHPTPCARSPTWSLVSV